MDLNDIYKEYQEATKGLGSPARNDQERVAREDVQPYWDKVHDSHLACEREIKEGRGNLVEAVRKLAKITKEFFTTLTCIATTCTEPIASRPHLPKQPQPSP